MIDRHDPGMTAAAIERAVRRAARPGWCRSCARSWPRRSRRGPTSSAAFPVEKQRAFLREVTERLGFNYRRGRIDVSLHPFCEGSGADIRMTTRFDEDNPLDSLFSAIHETGHGLYEQGLPRGAQGTALGEAVGMAVHESQSRLWENQVGAQPRLLAVLRAALPRRRFRRSCARCRPTSSTWPINEVRPTLIRVEADEVTYNLHIILRFELEKRLFAGDPGGAPTCPRRGTRLAQELLGLTPPNDREGVLQDVHWSGGMFGYFPSYCLGNMIAAQLWYQALARPAGAGGGLRARAISRGCSAGCGAKIHEQGRRLRHAGARAGDHRRAADAEAPAALPARAVSAAVPGVTDCHCEEQSDEESTGIATPPPRRPGLAMTANPCRSDRHAHASGRLRPARRTAGRAGPRPGGGGRGDDRHRHGAGRLGAVPRAGPRTSGAGALHGRVCIRVRWRRSGRRPWRRWRVFGVGRPTAGEAGGPNGDAAGPAVPPHPVALGEIGLDRVSPAQGGGGGGPDLRRQRAAFAAGLQLARRLAVPVVVHSRGAFRGVRGDDRRERRRLGRVVFHCFSEGAGEMDDAAAARRARLVHRHHHLQERRGGAGRGAGAGAGRG